MTSPASSWPTRSKAWTGVNGTDKNAPACLLRQSAGLWIYSVSCWTKTRPVGAILRRDTSAAHRNPIGAQGSPVSGARMNSNELCSALGRLLPSLFVCSEAGHGGVRVRTPMLYPDGGVVDVFVLPRGSGYIVTDFGDALGWLWLQSVSPRRSARQDALAQAVSHKVRRTENPVSPPPVPPACRTRCRGWCPQSSAPVRWAGRPPRRQP